MVDSRYTLPYPIPMNTPAATSALSALAHEHRLAVYRLLVQAGSGGLAAGVLAERLGLPASSLSFHLAQLTRAGLITQQRQSRSLIYAADYVAMNALIGFLTENCCNGAACDVAAADTLPLTVTQAKEAA